MPNRRPGQRKPNYDDETTEKVLKTSKTLCRADHGGQDACEAIRKKAREEGLEIGPKTADFIKKQIEEQIESCRKRMFPRIDEAIKRVAGQKPDPLETSP